MLPTSALSEAPILTMVRIFDRPALDVVAIPITLSRILGSAASLRQRQNLKCVNFERNGQMKYTRNTMYKVPVSPGLVKHIIILSCTT